MEPLAPVTASVMLCGELSEESDTSMIIADRRYVNVYASFLRVSPQLFSCFWRRIKRDIHEKKWKQE